MGHPKAFDTINRTQLWTSLYKKGLPLDFITHVRGGGPKTHTTPRKIANGDMENRIRTM